MAWAEDPPSRTRHVIANVEVAPGDGASELKVYSNFIVYRSRAEREEDFYVGGRQDVLRRVDGAWKIARRKLTLDQNVLSAEKRQHLFLRSEMFVEGTSRQTGFASGIWRRAHGTAADASSWRRRVALDPGPRSA